MANKEAAAEQPHNDRCDNCGACKSCGAGGRPHYVPMPYPVYPYAQPYRPYWHTMPTWVAPNVIYGTGQTFTSGGTSAQLTNVTTNATYSTGGGNYQ